MQLSHESYRTRWLILVSCWFLAAFALFQQARLVDQYLVLTGQLGLRGTPVAATPLKQAYPAFAADAQMWVRHALALQEGHQVQLRHTDVDNAPIGREVHWNSAWAWTIAGAGYLHHLFTGLPLPDATERATLWLNPLVMFVLMVFFSVWATKRAGAIGGMLIAAAMTCHDRIYEGFFPSYVDHHGLLTVSVLGSVLGAAFMGGGWWKKNQGTGSKLLPDSPETSRRAAILSALCGACGMWVSAASVIPPIAIIGGAGLLAVLFCGRNAQAQGAAFDGSAWRLWGRVGAAASLAFYLLEYFPGHLGFRMEANHPFHALAWLGGGELIAQFGERWLAPDDQRWINLKTLVWPIIAIAITPVTIVIGGSKVFIPLDPFMSHLHNDYIQEFLPMWKTMRSYDLKTFFQIVILGSLPLLAAIATISYRRRDASVTLWFTTLVCFFLNLMSWLQSRWMLNSAGAQICLTLVVLASWTVDFKPMVRWVLGIAIAGTLFIPSAVMRYTGSVNDLRIRRVSPKDAFSALNRDIAATLRASQPQGEIVLLTSPNSSVGIGYYGRFKTLGTLYWENSEGLKAAASLFGAGSEEEAAKLIKDRKVTHIAILSEEHFIPQYYQLLHPNASVEEIKKCFGWRLMADRVVPQWLQMLSYKVPDELRSLNVSVMLFKVNFEQNLGDAIYNVAMWQISQDLLEDADQTLNVLIGKMPQAYQPWLRKGELSLKRHKWTEAGEQLLKGISLAPAAERSALCINYGSVFYDNKQYAQAIQIYRAALGIQFTADIASYLGWILATAKDDSLRDGKEAYHLAQEALKTDPNSPSYLNVLAAALAELGRMPEAVTAGDQAVANARMRGLAKASQIFEERLGVLKTGKPLRN